MCFNDIKQHSRIERYAAHLQIDKKKMDAIRKQYALDPNVNIG